MLPSRRSPAGGPRADLGGTHLSSGRQGGPESGVERTRLTADARAGAPWSPCETPVTWAGRGLHSALGMAPFSGREALVVTVHRWMPQRALGLGAGRWLETDPGSEAKTLVQKMFLRGFVYH